MASIPNAPTVLPIPASLDDSAHSNTDALEDLAEVAEKMSADEKWHQQYGLLRTYLNANNNTFPHPENGTDKTLTSWISNQRKYAARWESGLPSPMNTERMNLLNEIDFFECYKSKWEEKWEKHFNAYKALIIQHTSNVRQRDKSSGPDIKSSSSNKVRLSGDLNTWARKQRREYQKFEKGEKCTITRSRIDKLDALHFDWNDSTSAADVTFEEKIGQLKKFYGVHGHSKVPKIHKPNPSLGRWVARMREQYRLHESGKASCLNTSKIQRLEDIGFEWTSTLKHTPHANWMTMYKQIIAYKEKNGHCKVPKNYKDNIALGAWTRNQRAQYMLRQRGKKSPMTEERIKKLEAIGFLWKLKVQKKALKKAKVQLGVPVTETAAI